MVYSKNIKVSIINAIADLDAVNQRRDNKENLTLLKAAQSQVMKAVASLEEFIERKG